MDYEKHYKKLIEKCQQENDLGDVYYENHHIIPKCMGGPDDDWNLVKMTPEQHYIAHLLLAKIYRIPALIYAANMMQNRTNNNKKYGWLKREFSRIERESKLGKSRSKKSIEKQKRTIREKIENGTHVSARIGAKLTEEHKRIISEANKGKHIPERSRSSLKGFILRYGEEEGTALYLATNERKSNSLENLIKRHGQEEGTRRHNERIRKMLETVEKNGGRKPLKHTEESKQRLRETQLLNSGSRGKVWVTNGIKAFRVFENEIPEGYVRGRKLKSPTLLKNEEEQSQDK